MRKENISEKRKEEALEWSPKTELGRMVVAGKVNSLKEVEKTGLPLLEPQIVDSLIPDLEEKLVDFKKTTRVTKQGRNFSFRASVLVGDKNGHIGIGVAKDKERWPAIKKAAARAKLSLVSVNRGCGSWECLCGTTHTVPFKVSGKSASVVVSFFPAPKGVGLVVGKNIRDVLRFAGIEDVWSQSFGSTGTKLNFVRAAVNALQNTMKMRVSDEFKQKLEKVRK